MKISFIATVFNEEKTIGALLDSIAIQSRMPDEIIIVDGGSTDATVSVISNFTKTFTSEESPLSGATSPRWKTFTKPGNRAVGRNEAVRQSIGDIIVCSDAGCVLDKDWVKNIIEPFEAHLGGAEVEASSPSEVVKSRSSKKSDVDVVAGYYSAKPNSVFEKCLVPYVLVMPDRVNPEEFLPATRSMAFRKSVWKKIGGFPEKFSHNEDYIFAKKLRDSGTTTVFAKDAIVYWMPRKNLQEAFVMFFRFAYGDAQAGILRPKVLLIFVRYAVGIFLLLIYIFSSSSFVLNTIYLILVAYTIWAIAKNYRYVQNPLAFAILPILQVTADVAVIFGTIWGIQNKR